MITGPARQMPPVQQDNGTDDMSSSFQAVNAFLGITAIWQPIQTAGSTNRLFRTRLADRLLVLRINADDSRAFGVNRKTEADVLKLIQAYGWAPKVLHNDWQAGWCLMSDHGESSADADAEARYGHGPEPEQSFSYAQELLSAVRQWQQIHNGPVFDYPALYQRYRRLFEDEKNSIWIALLEAIELVSRVLPKVPECLTHHDLHRGNLCVDRGRLVVLDWEYAAIGNPWFDAAALHRQLDIPAKQIATLPAWHAVTLTDFKAGLALAVWLAEALEVLWYEARVDKKGANSDRNAQTEALLKVSAELLCRYA